VTYNRRDLIGHWVNKDQRSQQMCQHACCRGYHVHPRGKRVILPSPALRKVDDAELAWQYDHAGSDKVRAQVLHELDRRDRADKARHERRQEHQQRVFAKRVAKQEEVDRIYDDAEAATHGHNLNAAGRAKYEAGELDDRQLFTGPESLVHRYGSDELKNYFIEHPRPTGAHFRGSDTRLGYAPAPRRARRRVA
jgi:hypothetical protein